LLGFYNVKNLWKKIWKNNFYLTELDVMFLTRSVRRATMWPSASARKDFTETEPSLAFRMGSPKKKTVKNEPQKLK
jgi:hypothetical protein